MAGLQFLDAVHFWIPNIQHNDQWHVWTEPKLSWHWHMWHHQLSVVDSWRHMDDCWCLLIAVGVGHVDIFWFLAQLSQLIPLSDQTLSMGDPELAKVVHSCPRLSHESIGNHHRVMQQLSTSFPTSYSNTQSVTLSYPLVIQCHSVIQSPTRVIQQSSQVVQTSLMQNN